MNKETIIEGLKNPLTLRGLTFILGAFGIYVSPEAVQLGGLVIAGLLGVRDTVNGMRGK